MSDMIFVAPHNDDETLFGAFTIHKYRPHVIVAFDSYVQVMRGHISATANARRQESIDALRILGVPEEKVHFLGIPDSEHPTVQKGLLLARLLEQVYRIVMEGDPLPADSNKRVEALAHAVQSIGVQQVFAPAVEEGGHAQHNMVAELCQEIFAPAQLVQYLTYTSMGKSRNNAPVFPAPGGVEAKLRALACYQTQIAVLDCLPHFLRGQEEFYFTGPMY